MGNDGMNAVTLAIRSRCTFNEVKECVFLVHLSFGEFGPTLPI